MMGELVMEVIERLRDEVDELMVGWMIELDGGMMILMMMMRGWRRLEGG